MAFHDAALHFWSQCHLAALLDISQSLWKNNLQSLLKPLISFPNIMVCGERYITDCVRGNLKNLHFG